MPAEWHTPITWAVDQLVTNEDLNEQVRDNLEFLKDPPTAEYTLDEASNYTTTSTSFVDVDGTNLALEIETAGGDVLIHFQGIFSHSALTGRIYLELSVDGQPHFGDDGGLMWENDEQVEAFAFPMGFTVLVQGLSAGTHTFTVRWKTSGATATLYAGAGTSNFDVHSQFWAREVS